MSQSSLYCIALDCIALCGFTNRA